MNEVIFPRREITQFNRMSVRSKPFNFRLAKRLPDQEVKEPTLLSICESTRPFWTLLKRTTYHHAISLVISQRIKFSTGRAIREKLSALLGQENGNFDAQAVSELSDAQLRKIGLTQAKIDCIRAIGEIEEATAESIEEAKIKGIGPWTLKALKIIDGSEPDIWLGEDYWLRQRLSELKELDHVCSLSESKKISLEWKGNRTAISNFLWRIRSSGVQKFLRKEELNREDFI